MRRETCCQSLSTFVRPKDLLSTSVNFSCGWETFLQIFVDPGDFPLTSVNYPCNHGTFRQLSVQSSLPSSLCVAGRSSVGFHEISMRPGQLPSTAVNIPCGWGSSVMFRNFPCSHETFCQRPSIFSVSTGTLVNFPCGRRTLRPLPSSICAAGRSSIDFHHLFHAARCPSIHSVNFPGSWENLPQFSSTFCAAGRSSAKFRQLLGGQRTSVNFLCDFGTFCELINVYYPCEQETFRPLSSAFHVPGRNSVNLRQLSMHLEDFLSTSVNFPCDSGTFREILSTFRASRRCSVNF